MIMVQNIKQLFGLTPTTNANPQINPANNPIDIKVDETYVAYGRRICGRVNGSFHSLTPMLQKVFLYEKQRQSQDEQLQKSRREELSSKLSALKADIEKNQVEQQATEMKISDNKSELGSLQNKLIEAKGRIGEENKMADVKMTIGLVILTILTLYLFIFYSSTFYSAFFKGEESFLNNGLADAMFDAQAIPMAFQKGFLCFVFIISAPIIFMALGYLLHFFSIEEGRSKYFKIGVTVTITFLFDCILAYLIAKHMYDAENATKIGEFPPFSPAMAITDVNLWAVIFCGFITYMIWGFVFALTMSAYEDLKTNKNEISKCENDISKNKEEKKQLDDKLTELKQHEASLNSSKSNLENRLSTNIVFYNETTIRQALSDFFAGWITVMPALGLSGQSQQTCRENYENTVNQLFNL